MAGAGLTRRSQQQGTVALSLSLTVMPISFAISSTCLSFCLHVLVCLLIFCGGKGEMRRK